MKVLTKVWNVISILSIISAGFLGFRMYKHGRQIRATEVQDYNNWMNMMEGAKMSLSALEPSEKPKKGHLGIEAASMSILDANKWNSMASTLASTVSAAPQGQTGNDVFSEMAQVCFNFGSELGAMNPQGRFVDGRTYQFTDANISIVDRNFMYAQIKNVILKGMPTDVRSISQVYAQYNHLNSVSGKIGVFSHTFVKFMKHTGQFR